MIHLGSDRLKMLTIWLKFNIQTSFANIIRVPKMMCLGSYLFSIGSFRGLCLDMPVDMYVYCLPRWTAFYMLEC